MIPRFTRTTTMKEYDMSFFANRKKDIDAAVKAINDGSDPKGDKLAKLIEHTIAETGGGSRSEHEQNLLRALKGK